MINGKIGWFRGIGDSVSHLYIKKPNGTFEALCHGNRVSLDSNLKSIKNDVRCKMCIHIENKKDNRSL